MPPGHLDAAHLRAILRVLEHLVRGNLARAHDLGVVIDVVQKHVERAHALLETGLQRAPFVSGNHVRQDVERNQTLGAGRIAIDGERDADAVEQHLRGLPHLADALGAVDVSHCDSAA